MTCLNKINLNDFISELQRESLPLQVTNRLGLVGKAIQDMVFCVPLLCLGIQGMLQLYMRQWKSPVYILLNRENIESFRSFPAEMPEAYRSRLIRNLKAVNEIREKLKLNGNVYYSTVPSKCGSSAEAEATGEIVLFDDICVRSSEVAQAIFMHEWSHVHHKDGYWNWTYKIAAAAIRIFTFWSLPWALLVVSPVLSYGGIRNSRYRETRADRMAVGILNDRESLGRELLADAEHTALQVINCIHGNNKNSVCTVQNYNSFTEAEKLSVLVKISDLGIRSISTPTYDHPSHIDRYLQIMTNP
jgi:Zn-dependent protease with chaperone function